MKKCSILLTDDNETDRYIFSRLLRSEWKALKIFEEPDGISALEFLTEYCANHKKYTEAFPPTVILLDVNMPRMDGFEFLEKFTALQEEDERYNAVVIVMLSSSERKDDVAKSTVFPCVKGYVVKGDADQFVLADSVRPYLERCAGIS